MKFQPSTHPYINDLENVAMELKKIDISCPISYKI